MVRQLVIFLTQLTVLSLAITFLMRAVVPFPVDVFLGFIGAFLVIYAVSAIREAVQIARDIALARDADQPAVPQDGTRIAVVGILLPTETPLAAPFSGRQCIYYRYAAGTEMEKGGDEPVSGDYSGLALTPCSVRSALRETRLVGVPMMRGFEDQTRILSDDKHYDNAERFARATSFERVSSKDVALMLRSTRFEEDDGSVRRDVMLDGAGSIRDAILKEMVIPSNSEVCAVGTWSGKHAGLIQKLGSRDMLSLYAGGKDGAIAWLQKSMTKYVARGAIGMGLVTALIAWRFVAA